MVKRISSLASNQKFRVRVLVKLLLVQRTCGLRYYGDRGVLGLCILACEARGEGSIPFGHPAAASESKSAIHGTHLAIVDLDNIRV